VNEGSLRELFSRPDFVRIWLVGAFAGSIHWLEILATAVVVFEITDSPLSVALVMAFRALPLVLFGAFMGDVAERVSRKLLLLGGFSALIVSSLVLAGLAFAGALEVWHIALGSFLSGTVFSMEFPVRRVLIGEFAGVDRIGRAMSLDSVTRNATRILGPALGGFLLELVGIQGTYLLAATLYLISVLLGAGLRLGPIAAVEQGRNVLTNVIEGFKYIAASRKIVGTLMITVVMNVWGFSYASMVPVVGKEDLGLSAFPIGILMSSEGLGALLGALAATLISRPAYFSKLYLYGPALFFIAILFFSLSDWYPLSLTILFLGGFGIAGFTTMQATLIFLEAAPEMRGRVMGAVSVSIGTGPLGILHVGALANWLGASNAITIVSIEGLTALIIVALVWPEVR
jgi:MFS family permease